MADDELTQDDINERYNETFIESTGPTEEQLREYREAEIAAHEERENETWAQQHDRVLRDVRSDVDVGEDVDEVPPYTPPKNRKEPPKLLFDPRHSASSDNEAEQARVYFKKASRFFDARKIEKRPDPDDPPIEDRIEWPEKHALLTLSDLRLPENSYPGQGSEESPYEYYMRFVNNSVHGRPEFSWAMFTTLISAMIGRNWRLETLGGEDDLCANLYVTLVGGSGTGKSLPARAMKRVLPGGVKHSPIYAALSARSDKTVMTKMALQPHMFWHLDEGANLYSQLFSKTFAQMVPVLCELYDGEVASFESSEYDLTVEDPYLTILSTTTEAGMIPAKGREQLRALFETGLMSRFLLCAAPENAAVHAIQRFDAHSILIIQRWLTSIFASANNYGNPERFTLSKEADQQLFWYERMRPAAPSDLVGGAWKRAKLWAQKLSMIYHVAQQRLPSEPISQETLLMALRMVHHYILPAHRYVASHAVQTMSQRQLDQIDKLLHRADGGIVYTDLRGQFRGTRKDFYYTLADLYADDRIWFTRWKRPGGTRPPTVVSLLGEDVIAARKEMKWELVEDDAVPRAVLECLGEGESDMASSGVEVVLN